MFSLTFSITAVFLYWKIPDKFKTALIVVLSYCFYACWKLPEGLIYSPAIFLNAACFWVLGKLMVQYPQHKKTILITGITAELCLLGYFKYSNFLYSTAITLGNLVNIPVPPQQFDIILPLAISFTCFILISYLVDLYNALSGNKQNPVFSTKTSPDFLSFMAYTCFFPHLMAGPIVRANEMLPQFKNKSEFSWQFITKGCHLLLMGLGIKLYIADLIGPYVNLIYGNLELQGFDTSWIATYGFSLQILCDFWGYTLMAKGAASLLGYTLPQNFDAPYFSTNIRDFWRRWHMSLSRWLKDYLYIPLGGSKQSKLITYRNLLLTMTLGGLWHGASWNFALWGLYHGFLLVIYKAFNLCKPVKLPAIAGWFITFNAVCIGWVLFRAENWQTAFNIIKTMLLPDTAKGLSDIGIMTPESITGLNVLTIIVLFLAGHWLVRQLKQTALKPLLLTLYYVVLLYLFCTIQPAEQPFIYFQF